MQDTDDQKFYSLKSRDTLKSYFRSGNLPTQQNFEDLIDSMVNRRDDHIDPEPEPEPEPDPDPPFPEPDPPFPDDDGDLPTYAVDFYQQFPPADAPSWSIGVEADAASPGLSLSEVIYSGAVTAPTSEERVDISRLYLEAGGNVGIGTTTPSARLEVEGFVASQGRLGTYADAQCPGTEAPADGQWHPILRGLDGLHAFEIVAAAYGPVGRGRYAVTIATALSAFGKSRSRVYHKDAWFWGWFQKIQFRWTGTLHDYGLDMRTASSFGADARIVYHITHLFNDRRPQMPPLPEAPPLN